MRRTLSALSLLFALTASVRAFAQGQPAPEPAPATAPSAPPTTLPVDDSWKNPAKAANPPLIPEPAPQTPLSTSGTDVGAAEPSTAPTDHEAEAKQERRIADLEHRLERDEQQMRRLEARMGIWKHLRIEGYVQPQFVLNSYNTAASPNVQANGQLPIGIRANDTIAKADGTTTNGTYFKVRRARLRTFYETDVMRLFLQLDAFPAGGIGPGVGTILRNAEATGIARWTSDIRTELTAGLFLTPFRRELVEISMTRPFIERTWFIQNAFPLERNYGIHANTIAFSEKLSVDLSVVNGQTLGEKTFAALPDLNRAKDLIGRATYRVAFLTAGVGGYLGSGQIVDPTLLRFKQYDKWAANFEAIAAHRFMPKIGESRLSAELTFASNMDSGVIYSFAAPKIPTTFSSDVQDLKERALYIRFEQDVARHFVLGYRYDMYTPNSSIKNNARDTHAFLAVLKISPNLRFMNEIGWAIDNVHATGSSPLSKQTVYWSSVLQAMF